MTEIEALKTLEPRAVKAFQKAKKNLVNFRKAVLVTGPDEVDSAEYHYRWSDALLYGTRHQAIEGFRESAKGQYAVRAFCLYNLKYPTKKIDYIVIIKHDATHAWNKLKEIEAEYTTNPLLSSNCVKIYEQSGRTFSVDVTNEKGEVINIRIEAYGKGESIRGLSNLDRRPKIVILDDPQDVEEAKSETVCETDWNWFLSDVMFLGQKTRIFVIGNNLGEKCILERIFANAKQLNFDTEKVKQEESGVSMWPAKYTIEEIDKTKQAYREMGKLDIWLREKMCEAISPETRIFDPADYRYFTAGAVMKVIERTNRFGTLDPASSPEISSCYRAIVINAVNSDNYWNIVDVPYGRWDSAELINQIFDAVVKWRLKDFGIEKGIFKQILEPFIYKEMAKRNVFFNIIPIEHAKRGTKLERIKMLQPRFKAHTIWFPDEAPWLAEMEAELAGVTKNAIKSLYADLMDALAMQEQIARAPYFMGTNIGRSLPREAETATPTLA